MVPSKNPGEDVNTEQFIDHKSAYQKIGPTEVHGFDRSKHFVGKSYKTFLSHWDIPRGAKILDVATGRGEPADYLRKLFNAQVIQTDLSMFPLRMEQTWLRRFTGFTKPLAVAKATEQPLPTGTFDAIHMKDALVHIEDKDVFLSEMSRLLKPRGKLLLVTHINDSNCFLLTYPKFRNEKAPKSVEVPFRDPPGYVSLVRAITQDGMQYGGQQFTTISPPYYGINLSELEKIAREHDLRSIRVSSLQANTWKPPEEEPDWNHDDRIVIEFTKL